MRTSYVSPSCDQPIGFDHCIQEGIFQTGHKILKNVTTCEFHYLLTGSFSLPLMWEFRENEIISASSSHY